MKEFPNGHSVCLETNHKKSCYEDLDRIDNKCGLMLRVASFGLTVLGALKISVFSNPSEFSEVNLDPGCIGLATILMLVAVIMSLSLISIKWSDNVRELKDTIKNRTYGYHICLVLVGSSIFLASISIITATNRGPTDKHTATAGYHVQG